MDSRLPNIQAERQDAGQHDRPEQTRPKDAFQAVTLGVLFLAAFLATEGLLVIAGVFGYGAALGVPVSSAGIGVTRGLFCMLLSVQVLGRTRQGRLWTMLYLAVLVAGALIDLIFLDPASWPDLAPAARVRLLGAMAMRIALIAWLAGPRSREVFEG